MYVRENNCKYNIQEDYHNILVVQQLHLNSLSFLENTFWNSPLYYAASSNIYSSSVPIDTLCGPILSSEWTDVIMISKSFLSYKEYFYDIPKISTEETLRKTK